MRSSSPHQAPPSSAFLKFLSAKLWFELVTHKKPPTRTITEQTWQYGSMQHTTFGGLPVCSCSEAVLHSTEQCLVLSLAFQTLQDKFGSPFLAAPSGTTHSFTAFVLAMAFEQPSLRLLFCLTNSLNPNLA